jgi:hypothetical protein
MDEMDQSLEERLKVVERIVDRSQRRLQSSRATSHCNHKRRGENAYGTRGYCLRCVSIMGCTSRYLGHIPVRLGVKRCTNHAADHHSMGEKYQV